MTDLALITGGAGFIGSHVADRLLAAGYRVRVLDVLADQIHGRNADRPDYLAPEVEFIEGDVRDPDAVARSLDDADAVFHFAARVGVGQSMYCIGDYVGVNDLGTATLLQCIVEQRPRRTVRRLVVASSMSVYGEGLYRDGWGRTVENAVRDPRLLAAGCWDPVDADGDPLVPLATPEDKQPALASVYALPKYVQERMALMIGHAYGIETVGLRFFNVYGTRQALSNPYTGVLAIFASRLLNGRAPVVLEDGRQRRDFVHVRDVAEACRLALETPWAAGNVFNIGSGQSLAIADVARLLAEAMGTGISPHVTNDMRSGDVRHCFADIARARATLGFEPRIRLEAGLAELVEWLSGQIAVDRVDEARQELLNRGLAGQGGRA